MGTYCGPLDQIPIPASYGGVGSCLFVPRDHGIPNTRSRIETGQLENLLDEGIVVAVDPRSCLSRYPSARYVRTIGEKIGDRDTGSEVVLIIDNHIDARARARARARPFTSQALSCLPPLPWSVSSQDLANPIRQDLRHLCIFSVDPPGCKNIDDALHCRALPNGNFEVGVHIADVTNFVQPGTVLDNEVAQRATSVSLVERRIDILPKVLSEDICSLRAGVERLAFSVIWEVTAKAQIICTRYTKSVIKNCAALSYVEAQARMDDSRLVDPVTANLRNMNALAKTMRQRRIDRGALITLTSETHDPLDKGWEAKQLVEEFMLAANVSVAKKILKHFPLCSLLRRQPPPTIERLEPLLRTAATVGLSLDLTSSKALAESLDCAVGDDLNRLLRSLAIRCMSQAVYFCSGDLSPSEYTHYSLAAPVFTHFTSPNRRYADVIVHRLLEASLGIISITDIFQNQHQITTIADNLNRRHWNAQVARRAGLC